MARLEGKAFDFFSINQRSSKPREEGITEVRDLGLSYRYLEDLLEVAGEYIDLVRTASGSQRLLSRELVKKKVKLCHEYGIEVSTGGLLERVLLQRTELLNPFLEECKSLEFDLVEVSTGLLILSLEDKLKITKLVKESGLKAMPEASVAYGIAAGTAFGGGAISEEFKERTVSADRLIHEIRKLLNAGAWKVTVESEGLTENVPRIRDDVVFKVASAFELKDLLFEAADPDVFSWYIKNFGPEVNLFVDHSQVIFLEAFRSGVWGLADSWGRISKLSAE